MSVVSRQLSVEKNLHIRENLCKSVSQLKVMESSLTETVRSSCKEVAERATYVRIDDDAIREYALSFPIEQAISPELDPNTHYLDNGEGTVAFFLTLDTINFGSGYFPQLRKRQGLSGYFTVASSLNDFYNNQGPLSAEQLSQLKVRDCTKMFGQNPENKPVQELMQLFTTALNDLGQYLTRYYNGSFLELVEAADNSAERLANLLVKMPFFDDVESYDDMRVHFYKRAQLTSADLSIALKGQGPGRFEDLHKLTIFADNLVPHVLRIDGILLYDENLAKHIDSGTLIPSGSAQEVEIRACAVHAVELMAEELRKAGREVTSQGLDYLLWNRGQQPYYKRIKPRHRTRTVFY